MSTTSIFSQTFETLWQSSLVKLPRVVPTAALHYTSPEGPHPYILNLPSRDFAGPKKRTIPVYLFLPDAETLRTLVSSSPRGADKTEPTAFPSNKDRDKANGSGANERELLHLPILLDHHGGGFYMGSPLEQAPFCALMTRSLPTLVLSIDYRMAPLDPFPAAIHDAEDIVSCLLDPNSLGYVTLAQSVEARCKEAFARVRQPVAGPSATSPRVVLDNTRICVAGFSSGANIALNMAISLPANSPSCPTPWPSPIPPTHPHTIPILLFYPSLDLRTLPSSRHRPPTLPASSPRWTRLADNLATTYVSGSETGHWRASPGLAPASCIHEQARMMLVLPGLDDLAEQSEVWMRKVGEEGRARDVRVERYEGMKHGWTQFPVGWLDEAQKRARGEVFGMAVEFVREGWGCDV